MKLLPILLLLCTFSAFAGDYGSNDRNFERREIGKARDRGEVDFGGYWMKPTPKSRINVQAEVDAWERDFNDMNRSDRRPLYK